MHKHRTLKTDKNMCDSQKGYGAICPGSPGSFDERDAFEDIFSEPLVASTSKPSFKTRKSWDSVSSRDSKRMVGQIVPLGST